MNTTTLGGTATTGWTDSKRYLWLLSPMIPILALIGLGGFQYTGWTWLAWGGPILVYGVIPVLDWLVGEDASNPPESAVAGLENDRYYRAIVYAYIPTQLIATVYGAWLVAQGDLSVLQLVGMIFTVGTINGIAINTAHELGHKRESLDRWLSKLTLAPAAYGHFFVEHNRGHHKNVATPSDPASSKMGESFWAFLPRTVFGSLRSAWSIEATRLQRNGQRVWSWHNDNLQAWSMTLVLFGAIVAVLGVEVLPFLLLQAIFGASLLEVVNYIEHYGLLRLKMADGRYERCAPHHSWNSNHIVTNLFLYQLQRHSDHHAHPTRRFQALRHFEQSPQLPGGYASMLMPAYLPWLWFRIMDPKVAAHHGGDLLKANLYPPKRKALLQRWHAPTDRTATQATTAHSTQSTAAIAATRHRCTNCEYVYDDALGCPQEGYAPGTRWSELPRTWTCPDCAVREKPDFEPLSA